MDKAVIQPDESIQADWADSPVEYHLEISDKAHLKRIYMPYIKNGAIFIATKKDYKLEDQIIFSVKLFNDAEIYKVLGKVVWINPRFTQGGSPQGAGVQFLNKEARVLRDKIENYLAGFIGDKEAPDAM